MAGSAVKPKVSERPKPVSDAAIDPFASEVTEWDQRTFLRLVSTALNDEQRERITHPDAVYPRQSSLLAVHWHPEFVPMDLIRQRVENMFPNRNDELVIPTQHNIITEYNGYAGVEVDCYSREFNLKVQLLVHFDASRIDKADVFRSMLAHTFRYRSRQLFDFMNMVIKPKHETRLADAADRAGADETVISFTRAQLTKLRALVYEHESSAPPEMVRNKLVFNYIETLRELFDPRLIHRADNLLRAVKANVKAAFNHEFFYATEDVIREVRALGGGIVIPHPEQFWPILLADYDVDGYEVWNPQSRQYTNFLIEVVTRHNKSRKRGSRSILIFMGDDCHMGEKVKDPEFQDPEKAGREIGVQPAWDDLAIRKSLAVANTNRRMVIDEYKARLKG